MDDISFFMPVHVRDTEQKEMWKEALRCIRKFYKEQRIFIIIDNCEFSKLGLDDNDYPTENLIFIKSEFNGAGEFLPFYYYHKLKPTKKAIFIHDTIFIKQKFNENEINNVANFKFLWHFARDKNHHEDIQLKLIKNLNNNEELINYFNNKHLWHGCFGVAIIITHEFLDLLNNKYNLLYLINKIKNKAERCALERVIAIIAFAELKWNINESSKYSLYGTIHDSVPHSFNFTFNDYKNKSNTLNANIIKCWVGR